MSGSRRGRDLPSDRRPAALTLRASRRHRATGDEARLRDLSPAVPVDPATSARDDRTVRQVVRNLLTGRRPAAPALRAPLRRVRVAGRSMEPTFGDGDWLLVGCWLLPGDGAVVLARDPRVPQRLLVKRARAHPEGWWLTGDNPSQSTDSRDFGAVSRSAIEGVVIGAYRRSRRPGRPSGSRAR